MDTPEPKEWDERLLVMIQWAAEKCGCVADVEHFKGLLTVCKIGLGNPRIQDMLRATMQELAGISPESHFSKYVRDTLDIFEREILIGELVIETIRDKSKSSEGETEDGY